MVHRENPCGPGPDPAQVGVFAGGYKGSGLSEFKSA